MRMASIDRSLAAISATAFPDCPAIFFVPRQLIRSQDGTDFDLRGFFHRLDLRPRFHAQFSNFETALFEDLVDAVTLLLIQTQVIVDPVCFPQCAGAAIAVALKVSSGHPGLIKVGDENSRGDTDEKHCKDKQLTF